MAIPPALAYAGAALAGEALGISNDAHQFNQQKAYMEAQKQGAKELADYTKNKQLEMWHDTNYSAQVKEAEKAGLNVGMIYGMGGAGGATAGSPSGQMPTSGMASDATGRMQATMGMGIQLAQMQANTEALKAQANKNNAEAQQIAGAGTDLLGAQKESIIQGITNQKVQAKLTDLQAEATQLGNTLATYSMNDILSTIKAKATTAVNEAEIAMNEEEISSATKNTKIAQLKQNYIQSLLSASLTKSAIKVNESQINKWSQEIEQGWRKVSQDWVKLNQGQQQLGQGHEQLIINKFAEEIKANYPSMWEVIGRWGESGIATLTDILTLSERGSTVKLKSHELPKK